MTEVIQREDMECAVCLQKCDHPTKLPCGHIFCFLCVKGVAIQNKTCALCRAPIPINYFDNPVLLEDLSSTQESEAEAEKFQWYYEGRNGWWKYDERSNTQLEAALDSGAQYCTLLVAGSLYTIEFATMLQTRRNDPRRKRHVKRDVPSLPAKGIAGIKVINNEQSKEPSEDVAETNIDDISENEISANNQNEEISIQDHVINQNEQSNESNIEGVIVNNEVDQRIIERLQSLRLDHPEIEEPSHSSEQEES